MQFKYDFILFENHFWSYNHYIDIVSIAKMLDYSGFSVAIVNYADESQNCLNHNFPILNFPTKYKRPNRDFCYDSKNKVHSFFRRLIFDYQQFRYALCFLDQINGLSNNVYAGSYSKEISLAFIIGARKKTKYFFWGLRSYSLKNDWVSIIYPIQGIKTMLFKRRKNINFVVSNQFIQKEFIDLGISEDRLIIRPERTILKYSPSNFDKLSTKFSLLTIGLIRREKQLEFSINSFKSILKNNMLFVIAGQNYHNKYENELLNIIDNSENIIRKNKYLTAFEYNDFIEKTHFLVLCDKRQKSTVTNGTMMEALLLNRPIIAPDYLPYSYYVKKYEIGYLYKPDDKASLAEQIIKAEKKGVHSFISKLEEFQKTLIFANVAKIFGDDIIKMKANN